MKIRNFINANKPDKSNLFYMLSHGDEYDEFGRLKDRSDDSIISDDETSKVLLEATTESDTGSVSGEDLIEMKELKDRKKQLQIKNHLLSHITRFAMLSRHM